MLDNPPKFSADLNPDAFQVPNTDALEKNLDTAKQNIGGINYDWSNVNALLGQLGGQAQKAGALAKGQGLTAGTETALGQDNLGANGGDMASLGKALMRLGSKASGQQAAQVGQAQGQQQIAAMNQAAQLQRAQAQARLEIYRKELDLQNQKFQMSMGVKQAQDGLNLANLQLRNMYNAAVAKAQNATEMGDITAQQNNFNQVMGYVGAGLNAASMAAAAGSQFANYGAAQDTAVASMQGQSDAILAQQYNNQSNAMINSANQGMMQSFFGVKGG